jgi:hypothetical protein
VVAGCVLKWCLGLAVGVVWASVLLVSSAVAAGDANVASCGNEALAGFRGYLPDCRAYEMVTPVFKDGLSSGLVAISGDGSRMIGESLSTYAGDEADSFGTQYEFSRTASGWAASALAPPTSEFPAQSFFASSADLGSTLWAARRPSQSISAEDLYIREGDGSMVKVGPLVPPAAAAGPPSGPYNSFQQPVMYAGASSDLSHVLFQIPANGALWPGDTTDPAGGGSALSLYEYAGAESVQPDLVGVNDEGRLISDCGTAFGSLRDEDEYNAVSENGETVFFTAVGHNFGSCEGSVRAPEVSELYARVGEFPINTVPISEPTYIECEECQTGVATFKHPAVAEQPAEFGGASADGWTVLFATEQELFAGDTTMNLYEYDFENPAGQKIMRVSRGSAAPEVQGVARVSEDGSHVYFVANGRLTESPRGGEGGGCLAELSEAELLEEEATREGRCRPKEGGDNLYLFERDAAHPAGRVTFIATLSGKDEEDWRGQDYRPVQATPEGRFLVFDSQADLTAGDTSSEQQVFEYDAVSEEVVRASVGEAGDVAGAESANTHASSITLQEYDAGSRPSQPTTSLAVSANGALVVFSSAGALTRDAGGGENTYEYRSVGSIANGSVYLISGGSSGLPELDPSGVDVFFKTAEPLLGQDVDTQSDVYDAREHGGFPAPVTMECVKEGSCHGPAGVVAPAGVPGSAGVTGSGDLAPPGTGARSPVVTPPRTAGEVRAEKLAKALKACRLKPRARRRACEALARRRYGPKSKARKSSGGGW